MTINGAPRAAHGSGVGSGWSWAMSPRWIALAEVATDAAKAGVGAAKDKRGVQELARVALPVVPRPRDVMFPGVRG